MSFYYISQELADVLELSTEKRYHIDDILVDFNKFLWKVNPNNFYIIFVDDNFKKLIDKDNVCFYMHSYYIGREQMKMNHNTLNNCLLNPNILESTTKSIEREIYAIEKCFLNNQTDAEIEKNRYNYYYLHCGNKRWLEESEHLIPEWKRETEKLQQKISVSEFSELKKETNILKKRISDLEDECVNLIDCEFLTMRLKKERENNREEIEKLHQRISMLEEENKQLKENFKTNVVDIIKQYVYSLFFFRK
jgi:cell division protein FtsB